MSIDPFRDYTYQEQRNLDLTLLFSAGLRDEQGQMRPEIRGVGVAAAALQAEADNIPVEMMGRVATTAHEMNLTEVRTYPDDLVEELEKRHHPQMAQLIRTGLAACQTEADYRTLAHWLALVHQLMVMRKKSRDIA